MNQSFRIDDDCIKRIHAQLEYSVKIAPPFSSGGSLTKEQLSVLIETAFWATVRFDEGRATRFFVVVASRDKFKDTIAFSVPVPYNEAQIKRLAPAAPQGGCLVVDWLGNEFQIWGYGKSRTLPWLDSVVIDAPEPGTVRVGLGPYKSFAVLNENSVSILEGTGIDLQNFLQRVLRKKFPESDFIGTQAVAQECRALSELARMILNYGHGGAVLIVPGENGRWERSLDPFEYRFTPPDATIRNAVRSNLDNGVLGGEMIQKLTRTDLPDNVKNFFTRALYQHPWDTERELRRIASLARVDGALIVTNDLCVLGFGAKITAKVDPNLKVFLFSPEPGKQPVIPTSLESIGGTRHQSAARFIAENNDAVAIVLSQDRHMSVMHWETGLNGVAVVRNAQWWV